MSYFIQKITARLCYAAILIICFLLTGCEKEEPPSDYFEKCLQGSWCVREFYSSDGISILHNQDDCVEYQRYMGSSKIYTIDNPAFCNLQHIGQIRSWQIALVPGGPELSWSNLCGSADTYRMSYSALQYVEVQCSFITSEEGICATMAFVGSDTTLQISSFILYPESRQIWLTMPGEEGVDYKIRVCKLPAQ